jgi:hypothetical protein
MHERASVMSQILDLLKQLNVRHGGQMAVACALITLAGCSRAPSRVAAPSWDPDELSDNILTALDKNSDGAVDAEELSASPGLAAGARYIDADHDKKLTREELAARFERYRALRVGLRSPSFLVTYRGRPVPEATLDFIPEAWLDGLVEPAHGTTDAGGIVVPQAEGQDLPGMRIGYYRVKVTAPKTKIPPKYSADDSPLGADVSLGDDASSYGSVELKITD